MPKAFVPGVVGKKITEARQARGITQTKLADLMDKSRQAISKYEKGERLPSPQAFDDLCRALKVPASFLTHERKREIDTSSPYFWRSQKTSIKRDKLAAESKFIWARDIFSYLECFVDFPRCNLLDLNPPSDPNLISRDFIESSAQALRNLWKLGTGPVPNIKKVMEKNGVILASYKLESEKLDAFSKFSHGVPFIISGENSRESAGMRLSDAHELGHLILHRNIPKGCLESKLDFELIEDQAYYFAGVFLFPSSSFYAELHDVTLDSLRLIKPKWKISIQAMVRRAYHLHMIDDSQLKSFNISIARRGWKKREPLDDVLEIEKPMLLKQAFEMIIDANIKSRSDCLEEIRLSRVDIEEISNLEPGFLQESVVPMDALRLKVRANSNRVHSAHSGEVINLSDTEQKP